MESHYIDPGWQHHVAIARVVGLAVLRLADADVVPLHYEGYATEVGQYLNQLNAQQDQVFGREVVDLSRDKRQANRWADAARAMQLRIDSLLDSDAPTDTLDQATASLEQVERELLVAAGLPGRPWFKHQIYAPGVNSGYGTQVLPGIHDALFLQNDTAQAEQYADYLYASLQRATDTLGG
jgi:N-acetylated-alpha-linked acidic dipeptidase